MTGTGSVLTSSRHNRVALLVMAVGLPAFLGLESFSLLAAAFAGASDAIKTAPPSKMAKGALMALISSVQPLGSWMAWDTWFRF